MTHAVSRLVLLLETCQPQQLISEISPECSRTSHLSSCCQTWRSDTLQTAVYVSDILNVAVYKCMLLYKLQYCRHSTRSICVKLWFRHVSPEEHLMQFVCLLYLYTCPTGSPKLGQHRSTCSFSLVTSGMWSTTPPWICTSRSLCCRLPLCQLCRTLPNNRESSVQSSTSFTTAGTLASSKIRWDGTHPWPTPGRRRQVSRPKEVPASVYHLGRRWDILLLQGEVASAPQRLLCSESLSVTTWEARSCRGHGTDDNTSQQLVQEPTTARQSKRQQG